MTKKPFSTYPLSNEIKRVLSLLHYTKPTTIQQLVVPLLLDNENQDIVVQSQTGSGKTAAYGIPLCEKIDWEENKVHSLILTPTRELAAQVQGDLTAIGRFKRLQIKAIYGKQSFEKQKLSLKQKSHVVVGTPGRVLDHLQKGTLDVSKLQYLVIDEADELFNRGFLEQLEEIVELLPKERTHLLFSATFPSELEQLMEQMLNKPVYLTNEEKADAPAIEHVVIESTKQTDKRVLDLLSVEQPENALIFCEMQTDVDSLFQKLRDFIPALGKLHGGMKQEERLDMMNQFKTGKIRYLLSTNLAARGIDVHKLELVIHASFPQTSEHYVHRTGRTGRNGAVGKSILLIHPDEKEDLNELEQELNVVFRLQEEPVVSSQQRNLFFRAKKMVHVTEDKKKIDEGIMKIYLNGGKQKKIRAGDLVGTITSIPDVEASDIGIITVEQTASFVEILNHKGPYVLEHLRKATVKGKQLKVHKAKK
ncbi:ATP-dependent RNA helicase YxiN [Bacillus sp. JCM 19046]|nr:ATP-dependent RNA helicase YxiN [Bacillus sp. JCM 19045]GAF16448.1 ATP-dependent RNA helicase YxiN [Bacillus sp. JCM 19046]